jgi:uncharacterized protein
MKLQPDRADAIAVTAYGPQWIAVNGERYNHSLFITHEGLVQAWSCQTFDQVTAADLKNLSNINTDILLMGCGMTQRFVPQSWLVPLAQQRIGLESMDTAAACRTFNILAGEGRKVAAVLLLPEQL